ncbi:uncharacterized protein [Spinacia oleracea]|uniref:Transposase-associated domain-containing protein n=1 Tax=Spinacia oleracea TaxID=3562 RepID=A0ABM3QRL1_SPIOL|nr:uncharacterized protein LOC130461808 [Spinacia oleracea]
MDNDRSWMHIQGLSNRLQPTYRNGVKSFLEFAFKDTIPNTGAKKRCPCLKCRNYIDHDRETMRAHLFRVGIEPDYNPWIFHGEEQSLDMGNMEMSEEEDDWFDDEDPLVSEEMAALVHDATNAVPENLNEEEEEDRAEIPDKFHRLMKDAEEELFSGCKTFSRLEFIVTLLHIKVSGHWPEKSFSLLLNALQKAFNYDPKFPKSSREAQKYTKDLGLNYVKIHACVNHCILYRKEYENADSCPICEESRWKEGSGEFDDSVTFLESQGTSQRLPRITRLVLRHFPLVPRLQRLFMSSKIAKHMRWHKDRKRVDKDILRHPSDSKAWEKLDDSFPDFAADPRNVRLGLSTDGFNPGAHLGTKYSIWPVFLVPYNLPPWMCMASPYITLSLLIPGPKSPGNDINVFLEPLIDELQELWEVGVKTYDSHSRQNFNMKAALFWTMSDFPAYGNLSGWSTCGKLACPSCHKNTWHKRLKYGSKECFKGTRMFLEPDHRWRNDKKSFDGEKERRPPPIPLSGDEILEAFDGVPNVIFGKKRKRIDRYLFDQWKKLSIFFRLPYWSKLLIRHNLDVMHIEKNICDNILGTILDIPNKTKDTLKARKDLKEMNVHHNLIPIKIGDKYAIPRAPYQLTSIERRKVLEFLSKVKVPDGYSSNIARCASMEDGKISNMKSHDCHVFLQDLLKPAFQGILPKEVLEPLVELSLFFKQLCSKTLKIDVLEKMEKSIAVTLCKLEKVFVPAFFDIMVHLPIHLAGEAKIAGPVQYRWQYRFEREMHTMKPTVSNKAQPEGSIANARIMEECLAFISRYLNGIETKFNRMSRNDMDMQESLLFKLSVFQKKGNPLGKRTFKQLSFLDWKQAQLEYTTIHGPKPSLVDWFQSQIWKLYKERDPRVTAELLSLSRGPSKSVKSYQGYYVNGYRFHTKKRQRRRKTQNSGVVVKGDEESGEKDFFGVLKEVIELEYDAPNNGDKEPIVVLFRCVWFDVYREGRGIKRDKFGGICLNFKNFLGTNEPFAMASQVGQVYYVRVHNEPDWRTPIKTVPRNFYNFPIVEADDSDDEHDDVDVRIPNAVGDDGDDDVILPRNDVSPELVNATEFESGEDEILNEEEEEDSEQDEESELEDDEEEDIPEGLYDLDSSSE